MPPVNFAPAALRDLARVQEFLRPRNPDAARRSGDAIRKGVRALGVHPGLGRLVDDLPEQFREWLIDFGESGSVVRYRLDQNGVTILAVRRQREG
jgi:plasmid stabilization system protein ParE